MLVESRSVFVNLLKVVPAVAEVEQVPCTVIAPILRVLTAKLSKGARGPLGWEKLAHSARCKRNLSAAKTNVEVDIVLEYKGSLKARVKEPGDNISINYFIHDVGYNKAMSSLTIAGRCDDPATLVLSLAEHSLGRR